MLKGDTHVAVEFLKKWGAEIWALTAIIPDGGTETISFLPDQWAEAATWIEERQGRKNLYFHVNPVRTRLKNKGSKEDVLRLGWLHVDIDPRAGEEPEAERDRALVLLRSFRPAPTVILDSGGGLQAFWKLLPDERLDINGDVARAQELEAYNQQLEKLFKADACHNVDRIMRLPGTINLPTERKAKKGRTPRMSSLIEFDDGNVYSIDQFTAAHRVQNFDAPGSLGAQTKLRITGNIPEVGVEELRQWCKDNNKAVSDTTLALIATGIDPIDAGRYPSRSEVLFRVCCDLIRAEIPDEMIYAVITGPNEIASSVKEKRGWESYALRQIERAHEEAIHPWLRKLNEKHAVIADLGGKCRIISEVYDPAMKRQRISKQSFEDFRNRYSHLRVECGVDDKGKSIEKPAGQFWLANPLRRQFETLVFAPGKEVPGSYNLWQGFACEALPGRKHESFLDHVRINICGGNDVNYKYTLGWMARVVQHPDTPGEVAMVLRGKRGTGKSFFVKVLGALFGRHFLQVSDSKHLVGSFNSHLRDAVLLFGDEAFFAGDKKHESVLKTLITEEHLIVEGKGVDAEAAPNFVHLILASNDDWVVPAGLDERRFFAMDVLDGNRKDFAYFKGIKDELDNGGLENLLHFLMSYDLSTFEVREVPVTGALQEQKILSMSPETQWFFWKLWSGSTFAADGGWKGSVSKDQLYEDYIHEMQKQGRNFRAGRISFVKQFMRFFPKDSVSSRTEQIEVSVPDERGFQFTMKKRCPVFCVPTLDVVRRHWDLHLGGPYDWPGESLEDLDFDHLPKKTHLREPF